MEYQKLCFATENNQICLNIFELRNATTNQQLSTQISLSNFDNNTNNTSNENNMSPIQITVCPGPSCPGSELIQNILHNFWHLFLFCL